jgi:hypothetical protein
MALSRRKQTRRLRPFDVVQLRARFRFLGRADGLAVCTVVDCLYVDGKVVDLLLADRHGALILATSSDVTYVRSEVPR